MATYKLRFFFDNVSGICLWGGNAATVDRFGYTVELPDLPLPSEVVASGEALTQRWNAFYWQNNWPNGDSPKMFCQGAQQFLGLLRKQLPDDFEVLDESGTA